MARNSNTVRLSFPTWQAEEPGFSGFWREFIADFESQHPRVRVALSFFPVRRFGAAVLDELRRGNGPDILHFPAHFFWQLRREGLLSPMPQSVSEQTVFQEWHPWQERFRGDEGYLAILMQVFGYVLLYHQEPFDRAEVAPPTTAGELSAVTSRLWQHLGETGFDAPSAWTTTNHPVLFREVTQWLLDADTHWAHEGRSLIHTNGVRDAIGSWHSYITGGRIRLGIGVEEKQHSFATGRSALIVDGPWVIARVVEQIREGRIRVASAPFRVPAGGLSHALAVARDSDHREEAWLFLDCLLRRNAILDYCRCSFSVPPLATVTAKELGDDDFWPILLSAARNGLDTTPPGLEDSNAQFRDIVVEELAMSLKDGEIGEHLLKIEHRLDSLVRRACP